MSPVKHHYLLVRRASKENVAICRCEWGVSERKEEQLDRETEESEEGERREQRREERSEGRERGEERR